MTWLYATLVYWIPPIPQPSGSSRGHEGMGYPLILVLLAIAEAEEAFAWVEAIAPVMARATTRVRTTIFIVGDSLLVTQSGRSEIFLWTHRMEQL